MGAGEGRRGWRGDGRVPPRPPLRPFRSRLGKSEPAKKRGAFPSASRPANQGEEAGLGQSPGQDQRPGIARCPRGSLRLGRRRAAGSWPEVLYYFWGAGGTITHSRRSRLNHDPRRRSLPSAPQRPVLPCLLLAATRFAHRRRGAHRAPAPASLVAPLRCDPGPSAGPRVRARAARGSRTRAVAAGSEKAGPFGFGGWFHTLLRTLLIATASQA